MQSLAHRTPPLLAACVCMLSGCLGGGIYSVQHGEYAQYDQFPGSTTMETMACHDEHSCGVSLFDALAATCGPPELCHEEYLHGDPGAMASPTPKYHPLPTRPVFQPMYRAPMASGGQAATTDRPGADDKSASSARWRGSLPQFTNWNEPRQPKARVAHNPLHDVTFPRLPAAYQEPPVLNPADAAPIRPNASLNR